MKTLKDFTFEDYLEEVHAQDYHEYDDDMPDAFEKWVCELDAGEVMELAEKWGVSLRKEIENSVMEVIPEDWTSPTMSDYGNWEYSGFHKARKAVQGAFTRLKG